MSKLFGKEKTLITIFILFSTWLLTSTSDLQPHMVIANQLPGQLVSTQIELYRAKLL